MTQLNYYLSNSIKTTCHKYVFKNISPTVIFMLRTVPLKTMRNIQNK